MLAIAGHGQAATSGWQSWGRWRDAHQGVPAQCVRSKMDTTKHGLTCPNAPAAAALHLHAEHEQKHITVMVEACLDWNATRSQQQRSPSEQAHGGSGTPVSS